VTSEVTVSEFRRLDLEEEIAVRSDGGTIALDGEREMTEQGIATAGVAARGPMVVDIRRAMAEAGIRKVIA
jgi:hypothetical protein